MPAKLFDSLQIRISTDGNQDLVHHDIHNHNDVKLASPSFWKETKAVLFEGADKVPAKSLPVLRLNKKHFQNNTKSQAESIL